MDLRRKVVKSVFWLSGLQIADQIIGFGRLLVLTHFLSPNEFGLVGIAWLVMQIITAFTQPGLHAALIQTHKNVHEYLNTVWTFLILRGILLFGVVFVLAPVVSQFFNEPAIMPLVRALSFIFLIESMTNIGMVLVQRELDFRKQFFHIFIGTLVDLCVSVGLAVMTGSVWAIVVGLLANNLVKVIISYFFSKYRPRLDFQFKKIKDLTNFSRWIFLSNILMFIYSQGDDILVGRVLGSRSLGLYQMSYKISNLPSTQITQIFSSVMMPALSKIQHDLQRISLVYQQYVQITSFLSIFVGAGIFYFAKDFVQLFLGDEWMSMVRSLQILTLWGTIRSVGSTTGSLWQALGKPKILTITQVIQVIVLCLAIYPLTVRYGIEGTAWAALTAALIPNVLSLVLVKKYTESSLRKIGKAVCFPLVSGLAGAFVVSLFSRLVSQDVHLILFVLKCLLFAITYFVSSVVLDRIFKNALFDTLYALSHKVALLQTVTAKKMWSLLITNDQLEYEN